MNRFLLSTALFTLGFAAQAQQGNPGSHFVENWDLNEDGQVILAETIERRSDVFAAFDSDDNGVLSSEEYDLFDEARANYMKENGMSQGARQDKGQGPANPANGMKREFTDANGDGQVTQEEFMNAVPGWFAQIDRNGDGVVTQADFNKRGE
ncbi:EF-hand domain-containing protein [Alisedimentitalea sp. MJ-SS2]|uniref:EF-hand domain-containing protein n=1 Tax=Aliisedimentitalea sp. MJ-SS2 TaxID=3049795 RepID=UPI0029129AE9|nr:EF-hand domain-containing protein [Alisedimentitalea sp. MJ-SS2]MDU8928235.1 EF-hand domain-containing protein [Alisedimentitalea sp. MJ-SS2]